MSTTLNIDSFSPTNIRERTTMTVGAPTGAEAIKVASTQGYAEGDIIYVGELSREGCEKAVIASLDGETTINLTSPLGLPQARFGSVTSVLGDKVHIYRAPNIDGTVPAAESFAVFATRSIDPDQQTTYYRDSSGGSEYWYCYTYFNETAVEETARTEPFRGDDFEHYASLTEIRREAGLLNAPNLPDALVDQQRRAAEAEINTALGSVYKVPFKPVPEIIRTITIKLAAGMLLQSPQVYGPNSMQGAEKLKSVRTQLSAMKNRDETITDGDGSSIAGGGISSWPSEDQPRAFVMGDRF